MITKTSKIWFNGRFVDWDAAKIHVLTHGLHYGSGVFEGIRAYRTKKGTAIFRLTDHMYRLFRSAEVYKIRVPYTLVGLVRASKELVRINKLRSCYIRPIVFKGYGEMGLSPAKAPVDVCIAAWSWGTYLGEEGVRKGVTTKIVGWERISPKALPMSAKATGQYLNSILAKLEALDAGVDEAILLDYKGFISEGPGENIFIIKDKKIITPPLSSGILPGITRDSVIKIAKDLEYEVLEKDITKNELFSADEAFYTGTAAEIVPIRKVDNKSIGEPGRITKRIQEVFYSIVKDANPKYIDWLEFV